MLHHFRKLSLLAAVATLAGLAPQAHAQFIVLKDTQRLTPQEIQITNGKILRERVIGGQKAQAVLNFSEIDHIEWENPKPLVDARAMMAAGKSKEAIALLEQTLKMLKPFKDIKGSPYQEVAFAEVLAMDAAEDFDDLVKEMPEVNAMKWDGAQALQLRVIKLNMDRRTSSDSDRVLKDAQSLLQDTDDSAVSAKLWMTIGDVFTKKEKYEEALMAYLNVPVFYGSQAALVPQAEISAARSLVKLERFQDAAAMFQRITDSYPGSEVGEKAKEERAPIAGKDNKPENFGKKAKEASAASSSK